MSNWKSPASAALRPSVIAALTPTETYTHFEDKSTLRRSRTCWPTAICEAYAAGTARPAGRGLHAVSKASAGKRRWSRRCCRWVRWRMRREARPQADEAMRTATKPAGGQSQYEFLPSAESILEEVVPTSFKVKLFKCFLDAAVSEQVARMVAMKAATENADEMIKQLSSRPTTGPAKARSPAKSWKCSAASKR